MLFKKKGKEEKTGERPASAEGEEGKHGYVVYDPSSEMPGEEEESFGMPARYKFKYAGKGEKMAQILEFFQVGDEACIMQAVMELQQELQMMQDSSLPKHFCDQVIPYLLKCLTMSHCPDIVLYASMALTLLMDLNPSLCNNVVALGGVPLLCKNLENLLTFDLVEHLLKALEKIAQENPYSLLPANGLRNVGQLIEFCDYQLQKSALRIMNIVTKAFGAPQDLDQYVLPSMPSLIGVIKYRDNDGKSKEIMELSTSVLVNIVEAFSKFFEFDPSGLSRYRNNLECIACDPLLDSLFEMVFIGSNSPNYSALSNRTWHNVMFVLKKMCKCSPRICKQCISNGMLNTLQGMLSVDRDVPVVFTTAVRGERSQNASETAIQLLDAMLPYRHLLVSVEKPKPEDAELLAIESEKERIVRDQGSAISILGEAVFPQIVGIYERSISSGTKFSCIQIIDKLCYLCDAKVMSSVMNPEFASHFLNELIISKESIFTCFGLRIAETILSKLEEQKVAYLKQFKREGVIDQLRLFSSGSEAQLVASLQDPSMRDQSNPYVRYFLRFGDAMREKRKPMLEIAEMLRNRLGIEDVASFIPAQYRVGEAQGVTGFEEFLKAKCAVVIGVYSKEGEKPGEGSPIKQAEEEAQAIQKFALLLESQLKIGVSGKYEEWHRVFNFLADLLVQDCGFTNYEAVSTGLLQKLHSALCVLPSEFERQASAASEEVKQVRRSPGKWSALDHLSKPDIDQLVLRHQAFTKALGHKLQGRKNGTAELVKRLVGILSGFERSVREVPMGKEQMFPPFKMYGKHVKIRVVYCPLGPMVPPEYIYSKSFQLRQPIPTPESISKSSLSTLRERHELYQNMHSVCFAVEGRESLLQLKRFLKRRINCLEDIAVLKGPGHIEWTNYAAEIKTLIEQGIDVGDIDLPEDEDEDNEMVHTFAEAGAGLGSEDEEAVMPSYAKSKSGGFPFIRRYKGLSHAESIEVKARSEGPHKATRIGYKFFFNGMEIGDLSRSFIELMSIPKRKEWFGNEQGLVVFQLFEKPRKARKAEPAVVPESTVHRTSRKMVDRFNSEELGVISLLLIELPVELPQITDPNIVSALKLLKLMYRKLQRARCRGKGSSTLLVQIKEEDFVNSKLDNLFKLQMQNPSVVFARDQPTLYQTMIFNFPFLLTHGTRMLHFRASSMDRDRAMLLVMQQLGEYDRRAVEQKRRKMTVTRENVVECGMMLMQLEGNSNVVLDFVFENEVGTGLGPTMEFYSLIAKELRERSGLWRPLESGALFPAPVDPASSSGPLDERAVYRVFRFLGWIIARAIHDDRLIDLPLSDLFWDLVLENPINLSDIHRIDQRSGEFFMELEELVKQKLAIEKDESLTVEKRKRYLELLRLQSGCKVSELGLTFVLPGYDSIELKPRGASEVLTLESLQEYLSLTAQFTLDKTISTQVQAFRDGFSSIFRLESLKYFKVQELEDLVCGDKAEKWSMEMLEESIQPTHGYDKGSPQYQYLLKFLSELEKPMQRLFLQYVTGSPRLPCGGFAKLSPRLTVAKRITPEGDHPDLYLPSVMTCQNFLKIPEYMSYPVFQDKFLLALTEGQNSFTLSQF